MSPVPQRVLYVVSLFPCWSETFIVREIEQLVARGVDVRILSLKAPCEALVHAQAEALMPRVRHARPLRASGFARLRHALANAAVVAGSVAEAVAALWRRPAVLAKTLVALFRALGELDEVRQFRPQWIHAHWATYPSSAAMFLSRLTGVPWSFTAHAHDIYVEQQLLPRKLERASLAVTISQFNVGWLRPWSGPDAAPLRVVHCGIDPDDIAFEPADRERSSVLSIGRLDPIKGFDVLLDAIALLRERGVACTVTIVGEGPARAALEAQRAALALDGVVSFAGAQRQPEIRRALRATTVFSLPSVVAPDGNRDGIPVALMEAMAAGAPVVTTAVSGIPELVRDGIEGDLVPPGDAVALADALQRQLAEPERRLRYARAARDKVEREFDTRAESARLLEHFGACLDA